VKATKFLINEKFEINARYRVSLMALQIPKSSKFPLGLKVKFVLIDVEGGFARLLVDNHEPFGFHIHTQLPDDHTVRETLATTDHNEALQIFLKEVERIMGL
jgi:hypothetical protein